MERVINSTSKLLYIFRNRETGEYVDTDFNPTDDIIEAVGYPTLDSAIKALNEFDFPDEWYIVKKVTSITIIGEPIEVTNLI